MSGFEIIKGEVKRAQKVVLYGAEGIGKKKRKNKGEKSDV